MLPREQLEAFFIELDKLVTQGYDLIVIGGTAMVLGYDSQRMTNDCDPWGQAADELLSKWKEASKKSGVQLGVDTQAGVAQLPEGFESRLVEADFKLQKLKIKYPEKHDLALSKVARLLGNDLDDIVWLHEKHTLNFKQLTKIYFEEFRPIYIGNPRNLDFNFLDVIEELFGLDKRKVVLKKCKSFG